MQLDHERGDSPGELDILESELADFKTAFEIASQLVGCSPGQQACIGQDYIQYATAVHMPNTRELVERLLRLGAVRQTEASGE